MNKNETLAYDISVFFECHDMLGGASFDDMFKAVLKALNERDVFIIIKYFEDIKWTNKRAEDLYLRLMEYVE